MKRIDYFVWMGVLCSQLALAHGGGLDSKGGHYNRKTGEYHYHRPIADSNRVDSVAAVPPAAAATPARENVPEGSAQNSTFWISSTGKRHNDKCRFFKATNGRMGTASEGEACKKCGG